MHSDDELKAENELLRLKLELEHGMERSESKNLSPEAENQWLNYIYNFENQYKDAKRVKVYDYIGRPVFVPLSLLVGDEINEALHRLEGTMQEKGIALDCLCDYEPSVIYKFITEELFENEIDDVSIEGMMTNFIYEEFHPNHDYDIRNHVADFVETLFAKKWDEQFHEIVLAKTVSFNGNDYDKDGITSIIKIFQEAHASVALENFEIKEVVFDLEKGEGEAKGILAYRAKQTGENLRLITGDCVFKMVFEYDYWSVAGFKLPGFGQE